ncbi:hypothetical protein D3C75_1132510 [compost metagenome]
MARQLLPAGRAVDQQAGAQQGYQAGQCEQAQAAIDEGKDVSKAQQGQSDPLGDRHADSIIR